MSTFWKHAQGPADTIGEPVQDVPWWSNKNNVDLVRNVLGRPAFAKAQSQHLNKCRY
jgi:hypothetical protein